MRRTGDRLPRRDGERGQTLVEFALAALVFFILIFGIFDGARLFQSWLAVQHAAREGARYAVTGRGDCDGYSDNREACIVQMTRGATAGLKGGGLGGSDVQVGYRSWTYPLYLGAGVPGEPGNACDAIEVRVDYNHQLVSPLFKLLAPGGVSLTGRQRMLNEPYAACGS
jgi:hypothetical protein